MRYRLTSININFSMILVALSLQRFPGALGEH